MAIATTAEYKTYAGISASTWDAQFDVLIPAVQKAIERFTGRTFDTATFTEYLDGTGTQVLTVKNPPIASITSIKVFRSVNDTPTAVTSTLYTFNTDDTGIIMYQPSDRNRLGVDSFQDQSGLGPRFGPHPFWPRGFRNIQVIYVGAYGSAPAAATMPTDLKLALYKIVDIVFAQTRQDVTLESEKLGEYAYKRAEGALADSSPNGLARQFALAFRRVQL